LITLVKDLGQMGPLDQEHGINGRAKLTAPVMAGSLDAHPPQALWGFISEVGAEPIAHAFTLTRQFLLGQR
jgi:hypothetical protein